MKKKPKYMEVYLQIKDRIINDVYPIGTKLPTGEELAQEFNASKLTVKKGLDLLGTEGVLISRSGYGTEVIRKPLHDSKAFGPVDGLLSVMGEEHVTSIVHQFSIELPSKEIIKKLKITDKDYIYKIVRSRFVDNKPYSLEQTYMPLAAIPGLHQDHLKKSVYEYIRTELDLEIQSSHVLLKGTVANSFDAELLGIEVGDFMIEIEKTVSLASGIPFEYSITRHTYEDFVFESVYINN